MNQYTIQNLVADITQDALPRNLYESLQGNLPMQRGRATFLSPSRITLTISGSTTVSVETEVTYTPPIQKISKYRRRKKGGGSEIVQSHRRRTPTEDRSARSQGDTAPSPLDLDTIVNKSIERAFQRTGDNIPRTI